MGNERWFLGDRDDREQDFDWHELAAERGIAREQAVSLYHQAMARAARTPWELQAVYVALLDQAEEDTWRPSPGKVTRTMRRSDTSGQAGESSRRRAGKGARGSQRGRRAAAPGKKALTAYLRARDDGGEARVDPGPAAGADMDHAAAGTPLDALLAEAEQSSSASLDPGLRQELARIVGSADMDMGGIRVHTGAASQQAARAMNARAFTHGAHIHFGAGRYQPGSVDGRRLIAHEVAHAVQQQGATRRGDRAWTVGASDTVHEREADRFATGFASGLPARVLAPIARGRVAEQTVQRLQDPMPEPDPEELVGMVADRLRQKRAEGPAALQAEVRALRAQSSGDAREAVEQAIVRTLTAEEIAALNGNGGGGDNAGDSQQETTPAGNGQGTGNQPGQNANNQNAGGQNGNNQNANGQNGNNQNANGQNGDNQNANGQTPGAENQEGQNPNGPASTGDQAAGNGNAGPGNTAGNGASTPAPMTTEQALQPVPAPPADQRSLIQNELAFHESWSAMRGSTLDRAGRLLSADDLIGGAEGALIQVVAGEGVKRLAQRIPVPGLGNMIGGAASAYALFSNGGAGLRKLGSSIAEGFDWEGKGPWQIAADVVAMIKSVLDLIGNICNILSGLAYAFAAIAAIGGLLSVFFPPLAFLVPYIPTAINFGRACGGVATVCLGISDLISPIPPILRAIHILVSDQDPLLLAEQENQYHQELQGAIASYGAASAGAAIESRGGSFNPVGQMTSGIAGGVRTTRGAVGDMRAGNAEVQRSFGFEGSGPQGMRTSGQGNGRRFFDVGGQQRTRLSQETESERNLLDSRRTNAQERRATANELSQRAQEPGATRRDRRQAELAERRAEKREQRVEDSERRVGQAENREQILRGDQDGSPGGESGNAIDGARQAWAENHAAAAPEPDAAAVERDERGHVVLPEPPGSLDDVDAHDQAIEQLQQQLRAQQQLTQGASAVCSEATQRGAELSGVHQTVDARMQGHEALSQQHTQVAAQNQDISQRTEQQHSESGSGLGRAGEVLSPLVGPARTVNGLVQRVPSNRFFDVSGTQNDLSQFVQGMEQITGGSEDAAEQRNQTQQVVDQRQQQTAEAGELHGQTSSEGSELLQRVGDDQATAASVAQEATEQRDQSQQQEQTLEQRIQETIAQRDQKWNALVGWAQQHYSIREQATRR